MFTEEWLCNFIELLVLVPSALSCYLPAGNSMKFSFGKTAALCCGVMTSYSFIAASVLTAFDLLPNFIFLPTIVIFFFAYRLTVKLDMARSLAIYVGVCAIETFPAQFANAAYANPGFSDLDTSLIHLALSWLLFALFVYPAGHYFFKMVEELEIPKVWYFVTALSAIMLIFNMMVSPDSYEILQQTRLKYLFPLLECFALAVMVTIYILFYRGSLLIIEHEQLKKRSQLLEMQAHQFRELQGYMRRTAQLRHDFKHSVHILSALAERGDIDGVRAHLSEYEQRFSEDVSVSYCSNEALNALFGYYHGIAESENIKTDWKIQLPEPLTVSELDLTAVFGNIMENAVNACAALPEEERYFDLTAEIHCGSTLYIVSTNSFNGRVIKGRDGYRSTKHSGRGTGLMSIAAAAEKYGGSARFGNSDKEFFVDVALKV